MKNLKRGQKMKLKINKAFFGKNNCFKLILNDENECYFHFGVQDKGVYQWKKVKMSDSELGEIINVLKKEKPQISFFHKFNEDSTQIWINKKDNFFFIKVKELSKSFSEGEQKVLEILLKEGSSEKALTLVKKAIKDLKERKINREQVREIGRAHV